MKLPSCTEALIYSAKFFTSLNLMAASAVLAQEIYKVSLRVLQEHTDCPGTLLVSLSAGMIGTAYCSLKICPFPAARKPKEIVMTRYLRPLSPPQDETPRKTPREIVAFDPGEGMAVDS